MHDLICNFSSLGSYRADDAVQRPVPSLLLCPPVGNWLPGLATAQGKQPPSGHLNALRAIHEHLICKFSLLGFLTRLMMLFSVLFQAFCYVLLLATGYLVSPLCRADCLLRVNCMPAAKPHLGQRQLMLTGLLHCRGSTSRSRSAFT